MPIKFMRTSSQGHDAVLPAGAKFEGSREKVVDHPRSSVFTHSGKKMFRSSVDTSALLSPERPPSSGNTTNEVPSPLPRAGSQTSNDGAAGRVCQRETSQAGKRTFARSNSQSSADGPVPHGNEVPVNREFGAQLRRVACPLTRHHEDDAHGKKFIPHSRSDSPTTEFTCAVYTGKNRNQGHAYNGSVRTNIPIPERKGEKEAPTTQALKTSQRFASSPLRNTTTMFDEPPKRVGGLGVTASARAKSPTLVGVMKAAPPTPPKKQVSPAPWESTQQEKLPPRGRRSSPFRSASPGGPTDGFSPNPQHSIGRRSVTPVDHHGDPMRTTGRAHTPTRNNLTAANMFSYSSPSEGVAHTGRRYVSPRSTSPFALHY